MYIPTIVPTGGPGGTWGPPPPQKNSTNPDLPPVAKSIKKPRLKLIICLDVQISLIKDMKARSHCTCCIKKTSNTCSKKLLTASR